VTEDWVLATEISLTTILVVNLWLFGGFTSTFSGHIENYFVDNKSIAATILAARSFSQEQSPAATGIGISQRVTFMARKLLFWG
jgi:hypothetical protein